MQKITDKQFILSVFINTAIKIIYYRNYCFPEIIYKFLAQNLDNMFFFKNKLNSCKRK